jgi:hypothetical protein
MVDEDRSDLAKKINIDVMSPLADPVVEEIYKDETVNYLRRYTRWNRG